jgi:hypothetical protein
MAEKESPKQEEGLSEEGEYGWISRAGDHGKPGGEAHSSRLGKVQHEGGLDHQSHSGELQLRSRTSQSSPINTTGSFPQPLEQTWEWTEISEEESRHPNRGVFVNLVKNPEKFTGPLLPSLLLFRLIPFPSSLRSGYSGPSARLVWKSIQEENCFGGDNDACFEKRVFYR